MTIDELISDLVQNIEGDFVPSIEAGKLVARLHEQEPQLLADWLDDHAAVFLCDAIAQRLSHERARELHQAKRRAFGQAVTAAESGDPVPLGQFALTYVVSEENLRRRVADMTGADHRFVADNYEASGKYDLMLCSFHRAVAKKVGRKRTGEVLTEEQYDDMFQSIVKRAA